MSENLKERISTSLASIQNSKENIYNALNIFLNNNRALNTETGDYYNYDLSGNLQNISEVLSNIFVELQEDKNVIYGRLQDVLTTDQSLMSKSLGELYLYIDKLINTRDPYYSYFINFIQGTLTTLVIPRTASKIKSRLLEDSPETRSLDWDGGARLNNGVDFEFAPYALCNSAIKSFAVPFRTKKVDSTSFQNMPELNTVRWYPDIDVPKEAFLDSSIAKFYIHSASNVKKIGEKSFYNTPLSLIEFNKVEEIEAEAFMELTNTVSINLPNTLKILGPNAFYNNSISDLVIDGNNLQFSHSCFGNCNINNLTIKEGIAELGEGCFGDSTINGVVKLPDSLLSLKDYCFSYCNFEDISFNDSLEELGYRCFYGIEMQGKKIVLPDTIKSIGDECFSYITIDSLENLTRASCKMCEGATISNVTFSKTNPPKRIEDKSFNSVWELYSIDCSLIEEIGREAFARNSLEKITFDEHLKLVENLAFEDWGTGGSWSDSNKVYYNGNFKQWCEINFQEDNKIFYNATGYPPQLYIDDVLVENINQILNETEEEDRITEITGACFEYYEWLKLVNLPYINHLGSYCFRECINLTTIILGSEDYPVETIGEYPLAGISGATITIYTTIDNFEANKYDKLGALSDCTIDVRVVNK